MQVKDSHSPNHNPAHVGLVGMATNTTHEALMRIIRLERVSIASDVTARETLIEKLKFPTAYVHRIGRTGRADVGRISSAWLDRYTADGAALPVHSDL